MKIMVVTPYFSPKIGGLETYALNVAKGLRDNGHDVFVVTTNSDHRKRVEQDVQGLRVIRLPIWLKLSNTPVSPTWYAQLRKLVETEKPDIINAHSPVPFMADMAFLARGKATFVLTYHAGSLKKGSGLLDIVLDKYQQTALKNICERSSAVISVYPDFVKRLTNNSVSVHFIPPGVDTALFKPKVPRKVTQSVLYVGRIERSSAWKGIGTLVQAMAEVSQTFPGATLQLAGDGDAVADYRQQAEELGISDKVIFKGALRGQALVDAYNSADMLILPSETDAEAFGTVLIEAMACGLPVIGSDIGGIPNVIQDQVNGLLVQPGDYRALAEAISSLLKNTELAKRLGTRGLDSANNDFSVTQLVTRTLQLLEGL